MPNDTAPATYNGHELHVLVAYATNLATCDLLYVHTTNPPAFADRPVSSAARGARSIA